MPRAIRFVGLTVLAFLLVPRAGDAQAPTSSQILGLARRGAVADAWAAWTSLAAGPSKLELGVEIAAAANQIPRGLSLYAELVTATAAPQISSLRVLTLAVAADLARSNDIDVVALACGSALAIEPAHAPCRRALETGAQAPADTRAQALSAYALGVVSPDPFPGLRDRLERGLAVDDRLRLALMSTRLRSRERLGLVRPLLDDADPAVQSDAVLVLAHVPGDDVLGALRNLRGTPSPVREALRLALACHGDEASLIEVAGILPALFGPDRLMAARALAGAGDPRGLAVLRALARGHVELERVQAAEALGPLDPSLAAEVLTTSLDRGSTVVAPAALRSAGAIGLGTQAAVYRRLADPDPDIRAGAVEAIATTLVRPR